jgi:Glycosyltransferase family 87
MLAFMKEPTARAAFAGVSLLLCLAAFALAARGEVQHQSFKAFYCAATAVREHQDPYRVEPLRTCERTFEATPMPEGYVEPAPLPGYAFAFLAPLTLLPHRVAAELFALLLAFASILAARCLAASLRGPDWAILLALTPLTLLNVAYGEIPPLATLAICAAGYFLSKERWDLAGYAVCCALVQPNVGAPAVLAVFLFAPRSRWAIVISAFILSAISLGTLGPERNAEYFAGVLPGMARAEIAAADQFSLAHLLFAAGVSPSTALVIGQIWFAGIAVLGIAFAGRLAKTTGHREMLALLPPAAVLFFGIYLHDIQLLIALPAALVVATIAPSGIARALATIGLALLAAVWTQPLRGTVAAIDVAGVVGAIFAVRNGALGTRVALAAAATGATLILLVLLHHFAPPLTAAKIVTQDFNSLPNELSPVAWARYLSATPALTRPAFVAQAAGWLGLLGVLIGTAATSLKPVRS